MKTLSLSALVLTTLLAGCGTESQTSGHIGRLADGTISEGAVDSLGHEWNFVGRLGDLPEVEASMFRKGDGPAPDLDEAGEARGYVFVTDGPREEWLTYELESFDSEAMAELDAAYAQLYDNEHLVEEVLFEDASDQGRIVGSDDRVFLSTDQLTVGGSTDAFVAVRELASTLDNNPLASKACTGTMLTSTIGITAAHCFASDSNGNTDVSAISICDGRGNNCVNSSMIFINANYRSSQLHRNDWALFRTNAPVPLGSANAWRLDGSWNEVNGTTVSQAGIPAGGSARAHSGCQITTVNTKTLGYNCDTVGGHSGGPTYRIFGSGPTRFRQIVAVHAGTNFPNNRGSRMAHWRPVVLAGQTILGLNAGESVP